MKTIALAKTAGECLPDWVEMTRMWRRWRETTISVVTTRRAGRQTSTRNSSSTTYDVIMSLGDGVKAATHFVTTTLTVN